MKYEILGRVRIRQAGDYRYISAPKIEVLLRVLMVQVGRVVTQDQLIDEIWGEQPPNRARAGLHVYVSQLRKILGKNDESDGPLQTAPPGYRLEVGDGELDYHVWEALLRAAWVSFAEEDYLAVYRSCDEALALWRGTPEGMPSGGPIMDGFLTSLAEDRLELTELLIASSILLGAERQVVGRLHSLLAEYPLREIFYLQLMVALYRMDRQADALAAYQQARHVLDRELGVGPCRSLRELHRVILAGEERAEEVLTDSIARTCPSDVQAGPPAGSPRWGALPQGAGLRLQQGRLGQFG